MAYEKGKNWKGNARGRKRGVKNKINVDVKKVISEIIHKNAGNLEGWLTQTAEKNPERAIILYLKLSEFIIPRLKHVEADVKKEAQDQRIKIGYDFSD